MSFLRWLSSFPGDPKGSPCCFASKNSPRRFFGIAVEVDLNYTMAPPKDAVDQTIARPPIADGNPYSTPAPWSFVGPKQSDESFSYLGGHRLSVSLLFVVHDRTFQLWIRGTSKTMMGSKCALLSSWSLLSFFKESVRESDAFYIFLQESKISKVFRISSCPNFFEDMFPSLESGGQLARSHFRPIPRCGHLARPCWVWARAEGRNGFDSCQVAQFTLVSWKTKEKLWWPWDFFKLFDVIGHGGRVRNSSFDALV